MSKLLIHGYIILRGLLPRMIDTHHLTAQTIQIIWIAENVPSTPQGMMRFVLVEMLKANTRAKRVGSQIGHTIALRKQSERFRNAVRTID
jgi:hypothetical protein